MDEALDAAAEALHNAWMTSSRPAGNTRLSRELAQAAIVAYLDAIPACICDRLNRSLCDTKRHVIAAIRPETS